MVYSGKFGKILGRSLVKILARWFGKLVPKQERVSGPSEKSRHLYKCIMYNDYDFHNSINVIPYDFHKWLHDFLYNDFQTSNKTDRKDFFLLCKNPVEQNSKIFNKFQ